MNTYVQVVRCLDVNEVWCLIDFEAIFLSASVYSISLLVTAARTKLYIGGNNHSVHYFVENLVCCLSWTNVNTT